MCPWWWHSGHSEFVAVSWRPLYKQLVRSVQVPWCWTWCFQSLRYISLLSTLFNFIRPRHRRSNSSNSSSRSKSPITRSRVRSRSKSPHNQPPPPPVRRYVTCIKSHSSLLRLEISREYGCTVLAQPLSHRIISTYKDSRGGRNYN